MNRGTSISAVMIAAALLSSSCGGGQEKPAEPAPPPLQAAFDACHQEIVDELAGIDTDTQAEEFIQLEDDGATLIVNTPDPGGDILAAMALDTAECVLEETGAPASIADKMGNTSALSGPADDEYDGISVEWSYAAGVGNAGFNAYFEA